jgi:hypothetical protein
MNAKPMTLLLFCPFPVLPFLFHLYSFICTLYSFLKSTSCV